MSWSWKPLLWLVVPAVGSLVFQAGLISERVYTVVNILFAVVVLTFVIYRDIQFRRAVRKIESDG